MKLKFRLLSAVTISAACAAFVLSAAAEDKKAEVTGTYIWTMPGRNGGAARTNTLVLKADSTNLTGKVLSPGRGGATNETAIAGGKVMADTISFMVVREYNGNSMTNTFSGKVTAEAIAGKVEYVRDGEPGSRDWKATRVTDVK